MHFIELRSISETLPFFKCACVFKHTQNLQYTVQTYSTLDWSVINTLFCSLITQSEGTLIYLIDNIHQTICTTDVDPLLAVDFLSNIDIGSRVDGVSILHSFTYYINKQCFFILHSWWRCLKDFQYRFILSKCEDIYAVNC